MEPLPQDRVLRFRPNLRVEAADANNVFLVSEREHFVLSNPGIAFVAMLIDGQRTVHEILSACAVADAQAFYMLCQLSARGYVMPVVPTQMRTENAVFWHDVGLEAQTVAERLSVRTV